jgi:hypothetical protein
MTTNQRRSYAAHRFVYKTSLDGNSWTSRYVGDYEDLKCNIAVFRTLTPNLGVLSEAPIGVSNGRLYAFSDTNESVEDNGELPVSLSGPIANPTTRQKFFLTLMNSKANRLWGRDPPVYCNLLSSCDRTSEQNSRCRVVGFAIGPDRLT